MVLKIVIIAACYIFGWLSHHIYLRIRPHGVIEMEENSLVKLEINIPWDEISKKHYLAIQISARK